MKRYYVLIKGRPRVFFVSKEEARRFAEDNRGKVLVWRGKEKPEKKFQNQNRR